MFVATGAFHPTSTASVRSSQRACVVAVMASLCFMAWAAPGQRQMEFLERGLVALRTSEEKVFLSWRLLGPDPEGIAFNVYRQSGTGAAVKLNRAAITNATCYTDDAVTFANPVSYFVRAVGQRRIRP